MRRKLYISSFILIALVTVKCATTEKYKQNEWRSDMMKLSFSMSKLLKYAHNEDKFYNPSNESKIKEELKNVFEASSHVDKVKARPDDDPLLKHSSQKFSEDMKMALNQFSMGNKRYTMYAVKNMSNYCVSCHTRTEHGRSNLNIDWFVGTEGLNHFEKAQYYFSIRDYDKGMDETQKSFSNDNLSNAGDWESLVFRSLAVAVRINDDPQQASKIISQLQKAKVPLYLKNFIPYWKKAIQAWSREKKAKITSRKQKYEAAKLLLKKASLYEKYDYGLIEYLRASTLLHEVIRTNQKDYINAHSMYLVAEASKPLKDVNLWNAHEAYYEACIRSWPETKLAQRCYVELEEELLSGEYILGKEDKKKINERLVELQNLAYGIADAVLREERKYFERMGGSNAR